MIDDAQKMKRKRGRPSRAEIAKRLEQGPRPEVFPTAPVENKAGKVSVESARVVCGRCGRAFYPRKGRMHSDTVEIYCPGCGELYRMTHQKLEIMKRHSRQLRH